MRTEEFGRDNSEVIILLHGGGLSWWNFKKEAMLLKDRYHVILPILDGHGGSGNAFSGIEKNAEEIIGYIDRDFGGKVLLIGGLSLGAQILLEILSQRSDICRYAIVESALAFPLKAENTYIRPAVKMSYGLISKRWFSKLQAASLRMPEEFFEDYYRDSCVMTADDLISVLEANTAYSLKDGLKRSQAKALVLCGGKERGAIIRSARLIEQAIPDCSLEMLPGLYHGEFSLGRPDEYVKRVEELIGKNCEHK
ncbi:MAG: alpha/beta fold hydrolase [Huintestinicola sp.]|uniref:alpha/beta fold hydrolase n=1 Tax=Huintestinicola sp. TaxID=2981661 RepID=UPI003F12A5C0